MATLVLSTIGTAIGGPVGSAIGALIGQSIDQELFAPSRRGPRVGDLTVQTSSYGTQMPRVYGTMRVAGTVIWSTDLVEHSGTGGAKGQPDVTYTYTVSFAVALSSREAVSIGRIWADGKLLRGAAGDLKVGGTLRFYNGSEDQQIDPLIASVEGIANTSAYRGVALAVFVDLELAEFGNRIPILTFELVGDDAPPAIGSILIDASAGAISSDAAATVVGYAAYGRTTRDAVQPLVDTFGVELFDDGEILREATTALSTLIGTDEFGNSADQQQTPRLQREQVPARSLPATLRLTYYDPARDYQTGEARAVAGEESGTETQQDLAAALDAGAAKALGQAVIARSWASRDKLTLRLPPKRLAIEPGTKVTLPLSPSDWVVDQVTVDGFVVVAELHASSSAAAQIAGDAGRVAPNSDVVAGPLSVALFDMPNVLGLPSTGPIEIVAASSATAGWKSQAISISFSGQDLATPTARTKSRLGRAATVLASAAADLLDDQNSVDVSLDDETQWLTSCDQDGLAAGQNLAVLGGEVIQYAQATPLGAGRFRLSQLLRGRGGTEWACGSHALDEPFCVLDVAALQPVMLPAWSIGATLTAAGATGPTFSGVFSGEGVRPPSPVNLLAELIDGGGLLLSWTRRSRQGFAWLDEIDAPLGESTEQYSITLTGVATQIELASNQPNATASPETLTALGAGPVVIEVRQIGDFAASHPAQTSITLS